MESLSTRVLTSVVAFSVISVLVWLGAYAMLPALIFVSVMCLYEYIRMLDRNDIDVRRISLAVFGSCLLYTSPSPRD